VTGLCGWYDPSGGVPDPDGILTRMIDTLGSEAKERRRTMRPGLSALGCSGHDGAMDIAEAPAPRRLCVVVGRPRWVDTPLAEEATRTGVARSFLAAYEAHGIDALSRLKGGFALAFIDEARAEVLLAVDRMGIYALAFGAPGKGAIVFGSTSGAVASHPGLSVAVDPQALFDYAYFHMVPAPRSAITGVTRLMPGTYALARAGTMDVRPYWEMQYVENETAPYATLKERLVRTLRESVTEAASVGRVGAFLSGGTDSSTIAGLLTTVSSEPVRTFSIGFHAEGYDEMAYARIAARHFHARQFEYYLTPDDVVASVPRIADAYDQPFGNASAVPTYHCARFAASEGVTHLLAGDGGDELFGGNARYATQYLLSLYSKLPGGLRSKLVEPLAFGLPGGARFPGIRKMQSYIRLASTPMPARLEVYNLVERLGAARIFHGDFLASVDPGEPLRELTAAYGRAKAGSLINRMLALDLKYTLADNDLPKVTRMCDLACIECLFPMLDDRVVAFSANLAPKLKLNGTRLRYLFKKALSDFLPREIIAKKKHGFGLPFGVWLAKHRPLRELAFDSVIDLKRRHVVRSDFIDELLSVHLTDHAQYYGVMVWVLMMLEQWFKHHVDTRSALRAPIPGGAR